MFSSLVIKDAPHLTNSAPEQNNSKYRYRFVSVESSYGSTEHGLARYHGSEVIASGHRQQLWLGGIELVKVVDNEWQIEHPSLGMHLLIQYLIRYGYFHRAKISKSLLATVWATKVFDEASPGRVMRLYSPPPSKRYPKASPTWECSFLFGVSLNRS